MQRKKVETEGLVRLLLSGLLLKVKQRVSFSNTQPLHDNRLVNEFEKSRNREPVCEKLHTPHDSVACRSTNNSDDLNTFFVSLTSQWKNFDPVTVYSVASVH